MDKLTQYLLYIILCPFVFLSFIFEPLTSDVRIYLGTEKLAQLAGTFPTNLDTIWEVKPVGSRFVFYVLDVINPFSGWAYQIFTKIVVGIVAILIIYYFSKQVSKRWDLDIVYPFVLTFLGIFGIASFVILEAEFLAVLVCLLVVALLLEDNKWCWILAGLLIVPMGLFKGLTFLMVLEIIPMWLLLENVTFDVKKQSILTKAAHAGQGFVVMLLAYAVSAVTIFPNTLQDDLLSAGVSMGIIVPWNDRIVYIFKYAIGLVGFSPLIVTGALSLIFVILYAKQEQMRVVKLLLSIWVIPVIMLFVLSEFFYYQYYPMVLAAIMAILYLLKIVENPKRWFLLAVALTMIMFCTFTAGWSYGMAMKGYQHWDENDKTAAAIDAKYNLSNQSEMLYFDSLEASYYFSAPPACRYLLPLPLQRDILDHPMTQYPAYWEELNCTLNYKGRYIIANDDWFNWSEPTHTVVKQKFDNEYIKVWNNTWDIYERIDRN